MTKQLFILGRERSGTTLLRSILNAHEEICIPPESTFIWDLWPIFCHVKTWNKSTIIRFIDCLELDPRFKFWQLDKRALLEALTQMPTNSTYTELCQAVLRFYSTQQFDSKTKLDPCLLGDKNPVYLAQIDFLLKLFPDAQFICIVRDYRDVLASIWSTRFETRWSASISYKWLLGYQSILKWQNSRPNQFTIIRYEDLVEDPRACLTAVLKKLGIEWSDNMLNYHDANRKLLNSMEGKAKDYVKNLDQAISIKMVGKWKHVLNSKQIKITESICGEFGRKFGYEPSQSFIQKSHFTASQWSQLYFRIERFTQKFPPNLKLWYLKFKWARTQWAKNVSNTKMNT